MDLLKDKLTILINSCEQFSDMWPNIFSLYEKNWPNHPSLIVITDGVKDTPYPKDSFFECSGEMSDRLIKAIGDVKTKYVFFSFDDYYLTSAVNEEQFKITLSGCFTAAVSPASKSFGDVVIIILFPSKIA